MQKNQKKSKRENSLPCVAKKTIYISWLLIETVGLPVQPKQVSSYPNMVLKIQIVFKKPFVYEYNNIVSRF